MPALTRSREEARRRAPPPGQPPKAPSRAVMERARGLAKELAREVRGEVLFDEGSRALYATDLSIYRQVPIGVVVPRDVDDVLAAVEACRKRDLPLLGRGCGTSLAGQACNLAVVLDFSRHLNRLVHLDARRRTAWVEPGLINDQLRSAAEEHHLTFAPDPATHAYCTLGGMIGNNSCGAHSVMGGRTSDNIEELDFLTYDGLRLRVGPTSDDELERIIREGGRRGEIHRKLKDLRDRYADEIRRRYVPIPRRVSGYNLDELLPEKGFHVARALVGSEGTCGLVLGARVRLLPSPPRRALLVIGYPEPALAGDEVAGLREFGPLALEAIHCHVLENLRRQGKSPRGARLLPEGNTWLLVEFGGDTQEEATERARATKAALEAKGGPSSGMRVLGDAEEQTAVWDIRESSVGASRVPGEEDSWPSWEDSAVAPERVGEYLRALLPLFRKYEYPFTLYGHFGDGCLHTRLAFDTKTVEGVRKFRRFMHEAAELVVSFGGSLSGEHGDGQARAELLPKMFGPELVQAFREFKSIWDPHWRMNPGKLVDALPLDQNLRVGPDYAPVPVKTHFQYPEDQGSLANATQRCFGVGKCRRVEGGTMCPSFMVTRDEKHTTRGRAHLLFEMLRGDSIRDGWRSEAVKDSLDLCLSCKGCKGECPVSVDNATYKAEFLSHYYEHHRRPLAASALGFIHRWAELGARVPGLTNLLLRTPLLTAPAKALLGIARQRKPPLFAEQTFKGWFRARPVRNAEGSPVVLWPDTFTNHFHPGTGRAAVEVLEDAGFRVEVPGPALCCGRPLYDFGLLEQAKERLREVLEALRPAIRAGVPVVGLEPSCLSVFRDELSNLFPGDEDAQRLRKQSFLLSELLVKQGYRPPKLRRQAVVHGHCHHKSLMELTDEERLLREMGLEVEVLDSGCCGMAGSFGYEKEKYDVSMQVGERVLLPAVREAPKDALIVADGFSCRSQIEHGTKRRALHLAEVLNLAREQGPHGPEGRFPERACAERPARTPKLALVAGIALVGGWLWLRRGPRD
ncbi:MAG TPA: FAD-linked oxidase C-terminal domain-containing protein [Myxococcaceae bacterium]|nr:FAD-linked oxidase C-terminal domain-containing protein [Myxococcaceae bacterium]